MTIHVLILVIAIIVVGGVADFLIQRAPFIAAEYKGAARWVILAVVIIWLLLLLLQAAGVA